MAGSAIKTIYPELSLGNEVRENNIDPRASEKITNFK